MPSRTQAATTQGKNTTELKNYRPITHLFTTYMVFTASITNRISNHLLKNGILPEEPKGCQKASRRYNVCLLISKKIVTKKLKRSLGLAWIDYSEPSPACHTPSMPNYHPAVEESVKERMTEMLLFHQGGRFKKGKIRIKWGIFQSDPLPVVWLRLTPLTNMLNKQDQHSVTLLLYMDHLKLVTSEENQLEQSLATIKTFSVDLKWTTTRFYSNLLKIHPFFFFFFTKTETSMKL